MSDSFKVELIYAKDLSSAVKAHKKFPVQELYCKMFPETFLHPSEQCLLPARWMKEDRDPNIVTTIVSHSECILLTFQQMIRDKILTPEEVKLIWEDEVIPFDENGDMLKDPKGGFFDEQFNILFPDSKLV